MTTDTTVTDDFRKYVYFDMFHPLSHDTQLTRDREREGEALCLSSAIEFGEGHKYTTSLIAANYLVQAKACTDDLTTRIKYLIRVERRGTCV